MKAYYNVRSMDRPPEMRIDDYSVWICTNVTTVEVKEEETTRTEYQYDMLRYDKNEYITSQSEQITDLQLALCELYETLL